MTTGETSNAADGTEPYVGKIEEMAQSFRPTATTIAAELCDLVLGIVKHRQKPWQAMLEADQREVGRSIEEACETAVLKIYEMAVGLRHPIVNSKIEQVTIKEKGVEVKVAVPIPTSDNLHRLVDLRGVAVPMVLIDTRTFIGERKALRVDADEPSLPLGDVDGEVDERKVEADLDTIIAADESEPSAGQIGHITREREAAEKDPYSAGKAAALQGLNETRNPFQHPSMESADWLRGHAEGEIERTSREAAQESRRRRRRPANGAEAGS